MRLDLLADQAGTLALCAAFMAIGAGLILGRKGFAAPEDATTSNPALAFAALVEAGERRYPDQPRLPRRMRRVLFPPRPAVEVRGLPVLLGVLFLAFGVLLFGVILWQSVPHPAVQAAFDAAVEQPAPQGENLNSVLSRFLPPRRALRGYEVRDVAFVPYMESAGCDTSFPACAAEGPEREVVVFQGRLTWTEQQSGGGNSQHRSCHLTVAQTAGSGWKLLADRDCRANT